MVLCFMFPVAAYNLDMPTTHQTAEAQLDLIAKDNPEMMTQMLNLEPTVGYSQKASGFKTWPLVAVNLVVALLALVSIFLYKNRVLQMRMVAVAFLLNVVYVFLLFFWAVDKYGAIVKQALEGNDLQVTWFVGAYAPLASIVLLILAHRAIKKDESMVRAADRLR